MLQVSETEIDGTSNDVSVLLDNLIERQALLNTGGCASTISKSFY